ncbi:MAG: hypothetical protein KR126chlam6_00761 [Candidatus Anoxychlamydiales bacterium]|nr:hypothetical protein [Candidatus Anoxychlamydiales bacterium]
MSIASLKALAAKSVIDNKLSTASIPPELQEFVELVKKYFDDIGEYFNDKNFNDKTGLDLINLHQPKFPNTEELPTAEREKELSEYNEQLSKYKSELSEYLRPSALKSYKILSKNLIDRGIRFDCEEEPIMEETFIYAAIQGDIDKIVSLSEEVNITEIMDQKNITPLMYAGANGHTDTAIKLIELGAEVDKQDNDGLTALMYAALNGHTDTALALIKRGADVNKIIDKGVKRTQYGIIALIEGVKQAQYGMIALMHAAANGHTNTTVALIGGGAEIDKRSEYGETALIYAAAKGNTDTIVSLIDRGAEVDKRDVFGKTALMHAAENGHIDTALALIERGAEVNQTQIEKESLCASGNFVFIMDFMDDATSLMYAAKNGHIDTVLALIDKGAEVNKQDYNGRTALMHAAANGHKDTALALIERGADVNKIDRNNGLNASKYAEANGHTEIVKILNSLRSYYYEFGRKIIYSLGGSLYSRNTALAIIALVGSYLLYRSRDFN